MNPIEINKRHGVYSPIQRTARRLNRNFLKAPEKRAMISRNSPALNKEEVKKEEKSDKWHRVERLSGKFMRRFRLPENKKMEEVKANGVLSVMVPKVLEKKPEIKSIDISS
ncbi:hypothetical protein AALP_AA2G153500 [Arabis alpina]|uniref:SHSP domain-containing protein n=1 Tax=Arabis alpina TaxID=50452 RepID=A0A087HHN6_ARAAL|nr:hypothetical protein AALP_AA2G153500 [Arabis alpina]